MGKSIKNRKVLQDFSVENGKKARPAEKGGEEPRLIPADARKNPYNREKEEISPYSPGKYSETKSTFSTVKVLPFRLLRMPASVGKEKVSL